jgi:hypothetical protein
MRTTDECGSRARDIFRRMRSSSALCLVLVACHGPDVGPPLKVTPGSGNTSAWRTDSGGSAASSDSMPSTRANGGSGAGTEIDLGSGGQGVGHGGASSNDLGGQANAGTSTSDTGVRANGGTSSSGEDSTLGGFGLNGGTSEARNTSLVPASGGAIGGAAASSLAVGGVGGVAILTITGGEGVLTSTLTTSTGRSPSCILDESMIDSCLLE